MIVVVVVAAAAAAAATDAAAVLSSFASPHLVVLSQDDVTLILFRAHRKDTGQCRMSKVACLCCRTVGLSEYHPARTS